ncbi:hypothetical protein M5D96_014196 [Drosophila gunungcola]|uniref:Uncharacterized protein n=1 Tax=Drosophila gunungcola TaxID=103775 RepID=A0A9Q0BIN2_9MUSC|nr:hypothetical protein M5D96_014196 [Drosophila gunungcola]
MTRMFSPQWTTPFNSCARNNHRRQYHGAAAHEIIIEDNITEPVAPLIAVAFNIKNQWHYK